jgi:hypothetical protein
MPWTCEVPVAWAMSMRTTMLWWQMNEVTSHRMPLPPRAAHGALAHYIVDVAVHDGAACGVAVEADAPVGRGVKAVDGAVAATVAPEGSSGGSAAASTYEDSSMQRRGQVGDAGLGGGEAGHAVGAGEDIDGVSSRDDAASTASTSNRGPCTSGRGACVGVVAGGGDVVLGHVCPSIAECNLVLLNLTASPTPQGAETELPS